MPYQMIEVEITQPLSAVSLSEETGLGVIVRYDDRVIGFAMQAYPPNSTVSAEALADLVAREVGTTFLQAQICQELQASIPELTADSVPTPLPSLTIAICTKDRPENLARCLNALLTVCPPDAAVEILVVDNAPADDRTQRLVETLPQIHYVQEPKPGLDFARNRAIAAATKTWLAFLDDDVVVDRHWLDGLKAGWRENPDAAAMTGLVLPYELETEAQILFETRGGFRRGFSKIRYGQVLPGNPLYPCGAGIFGAGCNMAFRRDLLLKLHGFDEALDTGAPLPGGGDLDIFYRVVRSNHLLVYEPQYLVYHQHRREAAKLRRQYWTWGLGFMAFVVKSYRSDPMQQPQFTRLIVWWFTDQLRQLAKSLLGRHSLPPLMVWAELWGGVVGLLGEYGRSQKRIQKIHDRFSST